MSHKKNTKIRSKKGFWLFLGMILIYYGAANAVPPSVTILSPSDEDSYAFGDYVTFLVTALNPDDPSSEVSIQWISTKNGLLNLTNNAYSDLERGTHTITLVATDTENEIYTESFTLYIRGEPSATISSPANNSELRKGEAVTFSGTGTDDLTIDDDDNTDPAFPLSYQWTLDSTTVLSESNTFTALGPNPVITLDYGIHTIDFTVTDRDGDTDTATIEVEVLNTIPTAVISAPLTGTSHHYEDEITLDGSTSYDGIETVQDEDDGHLLSEDFNWTSSIDGTLGEGEQIIVTDLSLGTHVIQLSVTDSQGDTGTDTIFITITQEPPVATINLPANGSAFEDGAEIEFMGNGEDPDDEDDTLTYEWRSDLDGILSTERTFTSADLSDGNHTITFTVTDPHGESDTDSITISTTNTLPTATILTPSDGARFAYGETITFTGEGMTYEDEEITGANLVWSSTLNDATTDIGTSETLSVNDLATGTHIITLTVTDPADKTMTDTITITIGLRVRDDNNTDINSLLVQDGMETITVSGGVLPYKVFATSPVNAVITGITDEGTTIAVTGSRDGTGTVTITDDEGTTATISVVIGEETAGIPPVADAGDNQTVMEGSTVILDGTGSTDSDDAIVSYLWEDSYALIFSDETSPQPTFLASSVSDDVKILTLSLTVTDENNNQDTDDVVITIMDNGITQYPADATAFFSTTEKEMAIHAQSGGNLTYLATINPGTITDTTNMPQNMIYGLIDFHVRLYNQVETVVIAVYLPEPAPSGYRWYKYSQALGWIDFSRSAISNGIGDGAEFSTDRTIVYLYITDNGAYDDNGTTLIINDPSGLGTPPAAEEDDDDDGWCFIGHVCRVKSED